MSNRVSLSSLNVNPTLLVKSLSPIFIDFCCYELFKRSQSPNKACAAAGIAGGATLILYCPRSKIDMIGTTLFYLVYKVAHYFLKRTENRSTPKSAPPPPPTARPQTPQPAIARSPSDLVQPLTAPIPNETSPVLNPLTDNQPSAPPREIPSSGEITKKYKALRDQLTLKFEDPFNVAPDCDISKIHQVIEKKEKFQKAERETKIRQLWNSREIVEQSVQLVKEAGAQMLSLYLHLLAATDEIKKRDERFKAMADLLTNDKRFSKRFYPSNTRTILHIYRFIRGMRYIVHCPLLQHIHVKEDKRLVFYNRLTDADVLPFFQPGTPQYACREAYNRVIQVYIPLIPYLPSGFSDWLVKDEEGKSFEIIPSKG